jgi:LacI family transcriptional regulator
VLCHTERIAGFTHRIKQEYGGLKVTGVEVNNDDDIESYIVTARLLEKHPETDALFLVAAGVAGACRAVADTRPKATVKVVGYDVTSASRPLIASGEIAAVITQEPLVQGAKPLDILLDYAGMDIKPERELFYTALGVVIRENL